MSHIILKMSEMFRKCLKCFENVTYVTKISEMVQKCQKYSENVRKVPKMSQMFPKCPKCSEFNRIVSLLSAGLPDLQSGEDLQYIRQSLQLDDNIDDEGALKHFRSNYRYNKTRHSFIYMLPIAGQTAEPNGLKFFVDT